MNIGIINKAWIFYKKFGIRETAKRIKTYSEMTIRNMYYNLQINRNKNNEKFWEPLEKILLNNLDTIDFIDIFHVPMGWDTPLFQRFQHMSLNVGKVGGIAFYGSHPTVDKDVKVLKKVNDKLYLINFDDYNVKLKFFEMMDRINKLKVIRLQSIDLATNIEELQSFMSRGYHILYEYIDELTPDITGHIPEFVWERHRWILNNEEISIIATSDKLYSQVLKHRNKNCILSCNGVDYDHWAPKNDNRSLNEVKEKIDDNKTIVGYHGALAKWNDYDLLKAVADDGRYQLLIIGYEHDLSFGLSGLKKHKNVIYLGHKSYYELNDYCHYYDIAIIPFLMNDITQSVSPVKLFEYMAAEKPIVSYALKECCKYESCIIAQDKQDFLYKIELATKLVKDKEYLSTLKKEAMLNTWLNKTLEMKELIFSNVRKGEIHSNSKISNIIKEQYIKQILSIPDKSKDYIELSNDKYVRNENDAKVIAYYLPQFYPFKENDEWWGKGTTEWNNVCRAVPQYVGHYQPRMPGELGFYDLRLKENLKRQIELAKENGVYGFAYYYYWFDGKRLLDKPFDMLIENKELEMPFCICWANENWTKKFDGTNQDVIMEQPNTIQSYKTVIHDMIKYLQDSRYIKINDKKLIIIYRPSFIPDFEEVLKYWRKFCREQGVGEIHIMAIKENTADLNLIDLGFNSIGEFHPGTIYKWCKDITSEMKYIREDFAGQILDYRDIVENKKYFKYDLPQLYRAVMPMWDNTARRNNKGMIFENASPNLYKQWLKDVISEAKNKDLEENIVFINAWNEWGEGTYLEPDKKYGYAYLQATKEAVEETR